MPMLLEEKPDLPLEDTYKHEDDSALVTEEDNTELSFNNQVSIRDYCRQVPMVGVHTTCGEAASMLNHDQSYPCVVLGDDQNRPQGLIMREKLYRILNGRFAADLFYRKPISHVADSSPVVVDVQADAPGVIDVALSRSEEHFYDCIIITEEQRLLGVLTMRDLMSLSRRLQHEAGEERVRTITESRQEISRIHESITKLVRSAGKTGEEAKEIIHLSEQGAISLMQVEASYNRVHQHMEGQRQHASDMLNSIETGAGMARSIRSLADQSALLAMNASIEAAHAGDYGRGFQVVASEIRALAKQTREVAGDMSSLLEGIGELTRQTVELVRASAAEIDESSVHVTEGSAAFNRLSTAVEGMLHNAAHIAEEGRHTGEVAEHIRRKLEAMVSGEEI
ncbi:methyl-accepting chemotaxis protein [Paenibacillus xylanilyticus]|uniref:CBS domain-containing protein n=1 Tax=Paenibacillus xylanilyticus TaxID=248903 RepID=A0A7Y6C502_9BACL|nr:methyl-accepting chemotaxis protein [Paenibacillus xylanilyticus]NUU80133.1 CBS domain-containing protein [Paenibacillus xylanilyticus]